jgi:hypothetical protein
MPKELYVGISYNLNITGTVPAECADNKGTYFDIFETSIGGCVPQGATGYFVTLRTLPNGTRVPLESPEC